MRDPHDRRGADAAHRRRRRRSTRRRSGRTSRSSRAAASTGSSPCGSTGRGHPPVARRAGAPARARRGRAAAGDRALRRADDGGDRRRSPRTRQAIGVAGVAVIAPPYFILDERRAARALRRRCARVRADAVLRLRARARLRATRSRSPVIERLRETVDNLSGMKVSDTPFAKVSPYMLDGLDVLIGAEALIGQGLAAGAGGAVSGLASAFPEVVVEAVRSGDSTAAGELRATVERFPRIGALKAAAAARGVPIREDVRPPLRRLTDDERRELLARYRARRARRSPAGRGRARRREARRRCRSRPRRLPTRNPSPRPPAPRRRCASRRAWRAGRRPATVRLEARAHAGAAAARADEHGGDEQDQAALHGGDATLPPLLATPIAPFAEAASRRRGRLQSMRREIRLERIRDHAAARPRAPRGARPTRSSSASATPSRRRTARGTVTSRGVAAVSPTRSTTRPRRSTTCCSSRRRPRRSPRSPACSRSPTASCATWPCAASRAATRRRRPPRRAPAPAVAAASVPTGDSVEAAE